MIDGLYVSLTSSNGFTRYVPVTHVAIKLVIDLCHQVGKLRYLSTSLTSAARFKLVLSQAALALSVRLVPLRHIPLTCCSFRHTVIPSTTPSI